MASIKFKTIVAAGAAAAALTVGIMPANAAGTYSLHAGSAAVGKVVTFDGNTQGAAPQVHFTDVTTGTALSCTSASARGTGTVGSGFSGVKIASIAGNKTGWVGCTGPLGIALTPVGKGSWNITATAYNATTGVTTGRISNVTAVVSGTGCSFTVKGGVPITYTNSTQILAVNTSAANLTVSAVSGCFGAVNNADKANFEANYKVVAANSAFNPVTITKP